MCRRGRCFGGIQVRDTFVDELFPNHFINKNGVADGPRFPLDLCDCLEFHKAKIPTPWRGEVDIVKFLHDLVDSKQLQKMNEQELKLLQSIERTSKRTSKNMAFIVWLIIAPWIIVGLALGGWFTPDVPFEFGP